MNELTNKIQELREEISPTGNKLLDELIELFEKELEKIIKTLQEAHETI